MESECYYAKIYARVLYCKQLEHIMLALNVDVETAKKIVELPGFPEVDAMELQRLVPSIRLRKEKK